MRRYSKVIDVSSLQKVYENAKKSNFHFQIAAQVYSSGARLPPKVERTYLHDLIAAGKSERAMQLWKSMEPSQNKYHWRSTGVLLYCQMGNIANAEQLANKGVHSYADAAIAKAHAQHQNVAEALQWLKGCTSQQRQPVMDKLASGTFLHNDSTKVVRQIMRQQPSAFNKPHVLASTLANNPDLLTDGPSILKALASNSKRPLIDSEFWRKNHGSEVRSELVKQGITPMENTTLNLGRLLAVLDRAISTRNHALADEVFKQKPPQRSNRELQLTLRYYLFKRDYDAVFALIDSTPLNEINMPNWQLIWRVFSEFNHREFPHVAPPDLRTHYRNMVQSRGIHARPKALNYIIECFTKERDYAFLLVILNHWRELSTHNFPKPTLQHLASRCKTSPHTIKGKSASEIVQLLCQVDNIDFKAIQQSREYLF